MPPKVCLAALALLLPSLVANGQELTFLITPTGTNLRQEEIAYLTDEMNSYVSLNEDGDEHNFKFVIGDGDAMAPTVKGFYESSSWTTLEFSIVNETGDGELTGGFDPYMSFQLPPPIVYIDGRHVLEPGNYSMTFGYKDPSCDDTGENCKNEATLDYKVTLAEIETPIPGDANLDGSVAFDDFLALSKNFGLPPFTDGWFGGDFNLSGETDFLDFLILSENFGRTKELTAAAVPEPTSAMLAFSAIGLLLLRRHAARVMPHPITTSP